MKIVCIADTHSYHRDIQVPDGDILIHAGDIGNNRIDILEDFNHWLGELPHQHKIIVAGNHDEYIYYNSNRARELLSNCIYLENEGCTIAGLRIWGSPMSPRFGHWWFMADRGNEIDRYWKLIPSDLDILMTHSPPWVILDEDILTRGSVGCWDLLNRVKQTKPKYHIFGHVHGGHGTKIQGQTKFINASVLDEWYNDAYKPMVIEL